MYQRLGLDAQPTQRTASGKTSMRSWGMGFPQRQQSPYEPARSRSMADSTRWSCSDLRRLISRAICCICLESVRVKRPRARSGAGARPKRYPFSQPALPIPIRRASRRGAEARWRFRVGLEGGDQCSTPCLWGRFIRFTVSNHPSLFQESSQPRKQTSPFPLCASARVLPIRSRSAFSYAPMAFSDGRPLANDEPASVIPENSKGLRMNRHDGLRQRIDWEKAKFDPFHPVGLWPSRPDANDE